MQVDVATLVGFVAGGLATYSFVPQVVKCWRTGEAAAVSLRMFAVRAFGLVLWTIYGFVIGSLPVLLFSALGLALSATILVLKVRCERKARSSTEHRPERAERVDLSCPQKTDRSVTLEEVEQQA